MRRIVVIVAAAIMAVGLMVGAADVFGTYGLNRTGWAESFMGALAAKWFSPYEVPAKIKTLAPAERAAVVNALGAAAKAFVETPEFKAAYTKKYEDNLPDALKPPRTAKQIADELRAQSQKSLAEMEAAVKGTQGDIRRQMEAALVQIKAEMKEQEAQYGAEAVQMAQDEKARYEEAKNAPPDPDAMPADPKAALKRALRGFLNVTSGVDYAAATKPGGSGRKVFANAAFEQKPREWKMCYRAGRDACEAARTFASSWLAELK